jgi:hypothetical protein
MALPGPQAADDDSGDTVAPKEVQPAANQVPHPEHAPLPTPPLDRSHPALPTPLIEARMKVPDATGGACDAVPDTTNSLRLPFSIKKGRFGNRR